MKTVKVTARDKRLIYLTVLFLLTASLWYFIIRPLNAVNAKLEVIADSYIIKSNELTSKIRGLDDLKTAYASAAEAYPEALKRFYPLTDAAETDALITGMALNNSLQVLKFNVMIPQTYTALTPYIYSGAAADWEAGELKGIFAACITLTVTGTKVDIRKFIDDICGLNSVRIVSFAWSSDEESKVSVTNFNLNMKLELYMYEPPQSQKSQVN